MKYNEFKPIITEEQALFKSMLVEYLEGSITKQDLIVKLHEHDIDEGKFDALINLAKKGFAKGKDFFKGAKRGGSGKPQAGGAGGGSIPKTPAAGAGYKVGAGVRANPRKVAAGAAIAGTAAVVGTGGDAGPDKAGAATGAGAGAGAPKAGKPDGEQSFGQAFSAARKAQGGPGGSFEYKGKKYQTNIKGEKYAKNPTSVGPNKTLALQQKLRAAGADIKADGLMGPNTRAAMKKYGIGQSQPAAPARPSTPAQTGGAGGEFGGGPARPAAPSTPAQSGGAGGEFGGGSPADRRRAALNWISPLKREQLRIARQQRDGQVDT